MRSTLRGRPHYVTVPDHDEIRPGTLNAILSDVAEYLGIQRSSLIDQLFAK
ncbi:MAG TPA: type II toxin-antitoxin system HicA family toxin [Candidatus Binatia bacterium]|nr:type II toxin-antitoxin system HicA family toxin [Candidatus Binatia bacterium]